MALDFDGAAGYYSLGSTAALDNLAQAAFAVSAWIYPTSTGEGGTGRIATHRNNTVGSPDNAGGWLFFMDSTASLGFQTVSAASATLANNRGASNQATLNAWQHVLLTYDDAGDRKGHIYVGSTEISYGTNTAGSAAPGSDASGDLIIGNNGDQTRTFAGSMAELAIWTRIPTADEIAALAAGYSPALFPRSQVVYMPMVRGAQELRQGVVTASGTHNPQPHPRVIYRAPIWAPVSAVIDIDIAGAVGNAVAAGIAGSAQVATEIAGSVGNAVAAGGAGFASVTNDISIDGVVGNAVAAGIAGDTSVGSDISISGTVGNAVAAGTAGVPGVSTTIAAAVGNATAAGVSGLAAIGVLIDGAVGNAAAAGITGTLTLDIVVAGVVANAVAAGVTGSASVDAAAVSATPGYTIAAKARRLTITAAARRLEIRK